ncbi:hypothetical protein EDB85DRAFT_2158073 [Lactarius pseudohatsudake]|nr:hypothetical protein EDB85DRAFT_2158073 [Lactarius pseudohatsudake]
MPQPSVDQLEVPATQGSHLPRPSKTRALENAAWHRLKPKTYPKKIPNLATTDPRTTKVNVPPPKKKHRSNTNTFLTAVDSELPVEDPNEAPRRQAHTTTTNNLCKVPPHLERHQKALPHSSEDEFGPEDKSQDDDNEEDKDNEEDADNKDLFRLDNEALRQTFDNEAVSWGGNQPLEPSQYRQPAYRSYEDEASDHGDVNVNDFDVDNGVANYGGVNINDANDDINNNINGIDVNYHSANDDDNNNLGGPQAHARGPLSKRATDRRAELVVLSDNNYGAPPASATALSAEHNARWPHAPICPPGPRQHNLLISLQPEDFKAILKEGIQSLHCYCAFHQGYIPVDAQTDLFIELLIKTATKLNKPHYGARLQKDVVLQKEVCDLLSGCISHYCTTIKQVAVNFVSHRYKLENDESMRVRQVKDLINNNKFIFEPKDDGGINSTRPFQHPVIIDTLRAAFFKHKWGSTFAQKNRRCFPLGVSSVVLELPLAMVAIVAVAVHASLEEKAYGIEFNADAYEDSYYIHIATLKEIEDNNKPAY